MPLGSPDVHILKQEWQTNGTLRVEVITTTQATCPHCQQMCVKIHDTRARKKRDVALREHPVELILYKRRFNCFVNFFPISPQRLESRYENALDKHSRVWQNAQHMKVERTW